MYLNLIWTWNTCNKQQENIFLQGLMSEIWTTWWWGKVLQSAGLMMLWLLPTINHDLCNFKPTSFVPHWLRCWEIYWKFDLLQPFLNPRFLFQCSSCRPRRQFTYREFDFIAWTEKIHFKILTFQAHFQFIVGWIFNFRFEVVVGCWMYLFILGSDNLKLKIGTKFSGVGSTSLQEFWFVGTTILTSENGNQEQTLDKQEIGINYQ